MFTGLIEKLGTLERLDRCHDGGVLTIRHDAWDVPLSVGDSVAVQGACLTVTTCEVNRFSCDVLGETLARTNLGAKSAGSLLNLERALPAAGRFGGHMVSGHVDGQGTLINLGQAGDDRVLEVECDDEVMSTMVPKGSVAVDGVSLTLVNVHDNRFSTHIIPHTWNQTSLAALKVGDSVNVETDMVGKYVLRYLKGFGVSEKTLSMDDLREAGFE